MTKPTKSVRRTYPSIVPIDSGSLNKYLPVVCSWVVMVSLAVPAVCAQTPSAETPKSTDSSTGKTNDATTVSPDTIKAPSATPPVTTTRKSTSSADDFIPGSEVLPMPVKTTAQSDEFVKSQKPSMDLALVLYKNNEFKQSLSVLSKLPQTEQVHYYTGLCYKGMGNFKDATTHFAWVAYYAKDAKLKSYAFAAIRSTKPNRSNIKKGGGSCDSNIFSSGEARIRSEELQHRIRAKGEGEARQRELSGGF